MNASTMRDMYALAFLGAALSGVADALCVAASRDHHAVAFVVMAALLWAVCGPIWVAMLRQSGGSFAEPAAAWGVAAGCCSLALAALASKPQTRPQWVGFGLVIVGGAVRACADLWGRP